MSHFDIDSFSVTSVLLAVRTCLAASLVASMLGLKAAWASGHCTGASTISCASSWLITDKSFLLAGPFPHLLVRDDNILLSQLHKVI